MVVAHKILKSFNQILLILTIISGLKIGALVLVNEEMDCGVSVQDRIVGGKNAYLGQWPWLARLGYNSNKSLQVSRI